MVSAAKHPRTRELNKASVKLFFIFLQNFFLCFQLIEEPNLLSLLSPSGREYVGPFKFRLATIEFDKKNTTHSDEQFETIQAKLDSYGGICLYRDGLRVLPYGRADGDLFLLEERRTKHAGREFFSYRRCCGGIFISAENNPNLKERLIKEHLL